MKPSLRNWIIPIGLLVLTILSFGLLLPSLGFYWDDWPYVLIARLQGLRGFQDFFNLDRPTTYLSYNLLMPLFGTHPIAWQIFTLLLRWLTALLVWWSLRKLWPNSGDVPVWAAVLFAVYPVFRQQPIALTYHQLWMEYVFYMLSIGAMVAALRHPRRYGLWTGLAILGLVGNFLISEYFLGVEMLRLVILWLVVRQQLPGEGKWKVTRRALIHWLPYLGVLLVYLAWRFLFLHLPGNDRNAPVLLTTLLHHPISGAISLAQMALQDIAYIVVTSWYAAFQPDLFDLGARFNLVAWGIAVLGACLAGGFLYLLSRNRAAEDSSELAHSHIAVLLGALLVVIAPLPAWVTARQVTVGAYSDRLAVPAMLGASLLIAGLVVWFIRSRLQQILVISLLVGLAIGANVRVANDYRWASIQQNRFFWQLYWRAPSIAPKTALLADAEVLPKTGLYSTASGINLVYSGPIPSGELPYWFFSLSRQFSYRMPEYLAGMPLQYAFRQFSFNGTAANGIILYYEPGNADCLRLPTPQDQKDPALSSVVVQALPLTNLSRIQAQPQPGRSPAREIFGSEPEHGWCYLFEKADLARQQNNWAQVAALGDQARGKGYTPQNAQSNTPQEWVPFIEGYARSGRWQEARDLNQAVLEKEPKIAPRLCDLWKTIAEQPEATSEAAAMREKMNCEK